jgi:hypothetical protein
MKTARIYSLIVPVPERFDDRGDAPLTAISVQRPTGKNWEVAILGTPTTIQAVRITIPEIENETIKPEDFLSSIRLRSFVLDCIRINYDRNAAYLQHGEVIWAMWNLLEPDASPNFSIVVKEPLNPDYRVNVIGLAHLMAAPPVIRPLLHLLADGGDTRLPVQFRFLSLYKIIEIRYPVSTNAKFNKFAAPFVPDFQAIFPQVKDVKTLIGRLSILRNKCAHIKLTSGDLGFSHIQSAADDLYKVQEIIGRMAIRAIAANHPDSPIRFAETSEQAAIQFAEMETAGLKPVMVRD